MLAVLALVFIFQNTDEGTIELYFWEVDAPTWLWLLAVFVAGVIVGAAVPWYRRHRS